MNTIKTYEQFVNESSIESTEKAIEKIDKALEKQKMMI